MRKSIVLTALLSIMSTTALAKDQFTFQTVAISGKWYAAKTMKNGNLESCSLKSNIVEKFEGEGDTAEYKTVVSIVYGAGANNPGEFSIGIDSNTDKYEKFASYDVVYSLDEGYYWRESSQSLDQNLISIPVSIYNAIPFLDTLKYASKLNVRNLTTNKLYNFDLTGMSDVYGSFTGCILKLPRSAS